MFNILLKYLQIYYSTLLPSVDIVRFFNIYIL